MTTKKQSNAKCIICEGQNLKKYKTKISEFLAERMFDNKFKETLLIECRDCRLRYFELRPSEEENAKFYSGYRKEEYQKQREKFEDGYTKEVNYNIGHSTKELINRKLNITKILEDNIDSSKISTVLDYGGDQGQFIPEILKNADKYVYDVSCVGTIEGVKFIGDENELKNYNWDFIMCCNLLEHLSYPMDILNKILSLLKPGGYLYIELPNEPFIRSGLKECIRRPRRIFEIIKNLTNLSIPQMHEHINIFNIKTFDYIFNNDYYELVYKHAKENLCVLVRKNNL